MPKNIPAPPCSGLFPLTPSLSPGERVEPAPHGEQSRALGFPRRQGRCSLPMNRTRKLLEMNECSKTGSWAQGAIKVRGDLSLRVRVRVRGNGANAPLAYRTVGGTESVSHERGFVLQRQAC